jgi:hypothetical protein
MARVSSGTATASRTYTSMTSKPMPVKTNNKLIALVVVSTRT